jgi:hypothetical protein
VHLCGAGCIVKRSNVLAKTCRIFAAWVIWNENMCYWFNVFGVSQRRLKKISILEREDISSYQTCKEIVKGISSKWDNYSKCIL